MIGENAFGRRLKALLSLLLKMNVDIANVPLIVGHVRFTRISTLLTLAHLWLHESEIKSTLYVRSAHTNRQVGSGAGARVALAKYFRQREQLLQCCTLMNAHRLLSKASAEAS